LISTIACRIGLLLAAMAVLSPVNAGVKYDYEAVVKDIELLNKTDDRLILSMWMPTEFWEVALAQSGRLTDKGIEQFAKTIDPYIVVAVVDAQTGVGGAMTFRDSDALVSSVRLEDSSGHTFSPLDVDHIEGNVKNLVQAMRPILASSMGAMGSHMEFLVFKGTDGNGARIADPRKEGSLTVHVGSVAMRYRLPLGSLLPPAIDRKTGESFPGNYRFNPFTGNKLSAASAESSTPGH
jgi:hypothetical protein